MTGREKVKNQKNKQKGGIVVHYYALSRTTLENPKVVLYSQAVVLLPLSSCRGTGLSEGRPMRLLHIHIMFRRTGIYGTYAVWMQGREIRRGEQ